MSIPLGRSWGKTKKRLRRPIEENIRCMQREGAAPQGEKKEMRAASRAAACTASRPADCTEQPAARRSCNENGVAQLDWFASYITSGVCKDSTKKFANVRRRSMILGDILQNPERRHCKILAKSKWCRFHRCAAPVGTSRSA
jgi:hypothetical protein